MKYYRKTENEYGSYVDEAGIRYHVEWCSAVYSPTGQTPEDMGYEPYESVEAAAEAWGLRHPQPEAAAASTYGLRRPPVYAKLAEPREEEEQMLDWGHYVTNWEENGYTEFASLEEAYAHFGIVPQEEFSTE